MATVLYVTAEVDPAGRDPGAAVHADCGGQAARSARRPAGRAQLRRCSAAARRIAAGTALPAPSAGLSSLCRQRSERVELGPMLDRQPLPSRFSRFRRRARCRGRRARAAAGVGRMVTISTRVQTHAEVLGDRRALSTMSIAPSARIRTMRQEEPMSRPTSSSRCARHPKVVAIGEAGLDYHYDSAPRDGAGRGFRNHIAAARATGLPLVIHARDADDDMAAILEDEMGKGAFPAVLHCFTGGARTRAARRRARPLHLVFRHPDLQEIGRAARHRARRAGGPHAGRDRRALSGAEPLSRQAQRAGLRRRDGQGAGRDAAASTLEAIAAPDHARTSSACSRKMPPPSTAARRAMTADRFTILGCGSSGGVPRVRVGWGACDPANPKNRRRRCSLLVEAHRRGATPICRYLAGSARTAARRRGRLARRRPLHPSACRPHPRHRRSARARSSTSAGAVDIYADEPTSRLLRARFGYCFETPPGSNIRRS